MNRLPHELVTYITTQIIPQYSAFDKAHQIDHALKVIEESLNLTAYYPVNPAMVYTIAAYHDLGLCEGRKTHHWVSGQMLQADPMLRNWFTEEEILIMKEAVEDHRASNQQEPRSIYGRIVSEADRIIDPHLTIQRTVLYGLSHFPELDKEEQYKRFLEHLLIKYAEGGYLKLWIPESSNAQRLATFRCLIADRAKLRAAFESYYQQAANR
ncbi:MAG: HD domain-containing protein [Phocaeicola sp.]